MSDKIKELQAQAAILKEQAAELQETNHLLREEAARVMAKIAANKAKLRTVQGTSALLAKYKISFHLT